MCLQIQTWHTVDHLVRFEMFCREAFIHNQHLVSVFFDLEKAYDTTWKYGIMKDLHGFSLRGRLPNCISNFLQDRSFKVRVGSYFSDSHPQEILQDFFTSLHFTAQLVYLLV